LTTRLILSDLDGTLLDDRLVLDPRDVAAAGTARAAGIRVGVATGRMYRSGLPHALGLGANVPLICYQGALIKELPPEDDPGADPDRAAVLYQRAVPGELSLEILELCRRRGYSVNVFQNDHLYVDEINQDVLFYLRTAQVEAEVATDPPLEVRLSQGSTKLTVVAADPDRFTAALGELRELVGDRCEVTRSLVGFCEITARDVNKGHALRWLCRHLGFHPSEVVALGDAPNDGPLLAAAGTKVAVETAVPEVLAMADWVVPGPGGGGLAELVRRVLAGPAPSQ
jgi:Cof subfamily protein (haloacid dehalogenase superfamily)